MARAQVMIEGAIPITFLKEGDMFVAYSPVLDLSTCGTTFEEAQRNFHEALDIFFDECLKHKTLDRALESLGWQRTHTAHPRWQPPAIVGQDSLHVSVPAAR